MSDRMAFFLGHLIVVALFLVVVLIGMHFGWTQPPHCR